MTKKRSSAPRKASKAKTAVASRGKALTRRELLELQLFMRLTREWELRFEKMFKTGAVSKWYSGVGHEGTTVPASTALEPGDVLLTLHRNSGAILRAYLDPEQLFPGLLPKGRTRTAPSADARQLLTRLASQMLGKRDGFSKGRERSYHYGLFAEDHGIRHIGMISHLGSMIPVAAGAALALQQQESDRVVVNFIGEGATSTGEFHEGLNMAAVLRLPFILVIENNQFAFSTPAREQFACERLIDRAPGYGVAGVHVDGNDPEQMLKVMREAVKRARKGEGPTLIEAVLGRMRGHSEGDDSLNQVPESDLMRYLADDPVSRFEASLIERGTASATHFEKVANLCQKLLIDIVDRAREGADPDPGEERDIYA